MLYFVVEHCHQSAVETKIVRSTSRYVMCVAVMCAVVACRTEPFRSMRTTYVSREQPVPSRGDATDAYFDAVYGHQYVLAQIDARRAERFTALARSLDVLENADRDTLAMAMRTRLQALGLHRVGAEITVRDGADVRLNAWYDAVVAPPGERARHGTMIDTRFAELVERIDVTFSPVVDAPSLAPVMGEVRTFLREAEATRRCAERLLGPLAAVLTRGEGLQRGVPSWYEGEFRDAERVVLGVRPRATLHAQESTRIERWLIGVLQPEDDEAPVER
jgi:hypothetical protein